MIQSMTGFGKATLQLPTKKITIEGFFIYQHELNAFNRTNRDFIYGIGYSHEF